MSTFRSYRMQSPAAVVAPAVQENRLQKSHLIGMVVVGAVVVGTCIFTAGCGGGGGGGAPTAPAVGIGVSGWPSVNNPPNGCSNMSNSLVCNTNRLALSFENVRAGSEWTLDVNGRQTKATVGGDGNLSFSNVVLDEGANTIKLTGVDERGQTVSYSTTLTVDTTPPQLTNFTINPDPAKVGTTYFQFESNQPLDTSSISVSLNDSAGTSIPATFVSADAVNERTGARVALTTPGEVEAFRSANASYGTWRIIYSFEVPASAAQGKLTATVSAKNTIGTGTKNTITSSVGTGGVDTVAPQVTSATAAMDGKDITGKVVGNGTVEITINGNADLKELTEVSLNGTQGTLKSKNGSSFVYSILVNLPENTVQVQSLYVKGKDAAGNETAYSVAEFFTADTTPLTLPIDSVITSLTAKVGGQQVASTTPLSAGTVVELDIGAGANFGSITKVEVIGGSEATLVSQNPPVYQYAITTADTDGAKTVKITGTDNRGNAVEASFQAFTVQQEAQPPGGGTLVAEAVLEAQQEVMLSGAFSGYKLKVNTVSSTEANLSVSLSDGTEIWSGVIPQGDTAFLAVAGQPDMYLGVKSISDSKVTVDVYEGNPNGSAQRRGDAKLEVLERRASIPMSPFSKAFWDGRAG